MAMEHIAAVGAGRMGRGIAHVMAYAGFEVTMLDMKVRSDESRKSLRESALGEVATNLKTLATLNLMSSDDLVTILSRISFAGPEQAAEVLAKADVIFEGVPEVMDLKAASLKEISQLAKDAIIASTTSTFDANELASYVDCPERFANAHWLNPAFLIPVVEVSPADTTSQATLESLMNLLRRAGKMPVACKPSPGFIVPRIQALAMNEAARLVEDGVATPADVDTATRYGFGVRFAILGLLEFIDYGGGDILHYASRYLSEALPSERHVAPGIVNQMMDKQERGLRDGKGFYDYTNMDVDAYQRETLTKLVDLLAHLNLVPKPHSATVESTSKSSSSA